jgi:hypothetical protein
MAAKNDFVIKSGQGRMLLCSVARTPLAPRLLQWRPA